MNCNNEVFPTISDSDLYFELDSIENSGSSIETLFLSDPTTGIMKKSLKTGRKKNTFTSILESFFNSACHHPKKEFFNAFVIRAIKRSFRKIKENHLPSKTSIAINCDDKTQRELWAKATEIYLENPRAIDEIADSKSKSTPGKGNKVHRSFTNKFCKEFFSNPYVKRMYNVFVELIFVDWDLNRLGKTMMFSCCSLEMHHDECYCKWKILKDYMANIYLDELDDL